MSNNLITSNIYLPLPEEIVVYSGRFLMQAGKVLYLRNISIGANYYWVIGPFISKQVAKPIVSMLKEKIGEKIIIKRYNDVFEIFMENKINNILKNSFIDDEQKNILIDDANIEIAKMIPFIAETYGYSSNYISAPELQNYLNQPSEDSTDIYSDNDNYEIAVNNTPLSDYDNPLSAYDIPLLALLPGTILHN